MRKGYVVAVTALALVWAVAECALASRWLDSAVLFTTPHPDEAHRNAVDTLWLSAVTVAGVMVLLLALPVYQAFLA